VLFVRMINRVLGEQAPKQRSLAATAAEVHRAHVHIAEGVLAGDADAAVRRTNRHLSAVMEHFPEGHRAETARTRSSRSSAAR
jgi:DNA-binding FadR family transcriptional regulator